MSLYLNIVFIGCRFIEAVIHSSTLQNIYYSAHEFATLPEFQSAQRLNNR